jgi:MFS family permease
MVLSPNPQNQESKHKAAAKVRNSRFFTNAEKKWISSVASFGAMFSTLSSYIYFPALVHMANDLGVLVALINLTVTSYLIVAGIAPAFMGDLADQGGRRPAYLLMFVLVVASNIGLALQDSYPALFVLRMVQNAGASGINIPFHVAYQKRGRIPHGYETGS